MDGFAAYLEQGPPSVLRVSGEIDLATAEPFRAALKDAVSANVRVIDMAEVPFIDASGLRVILQIAESLNGDGPLTLIHAARVARLFTVIGLAETPSISFDDAT